MLVLSNPFYENPEANARHLLHEQMLNDAQRSFQQSLAELFALRSLLFQGHLCLCIPLHSFQSASILPGYLQLSQLQQPQQHLQSSPGPLQQSHKAYTAETAKETKLFVSLGSNDHQKKMSAFKSEECKLKADCIEIVVDLREVLPAEICVGIEENSIRIDVNRVDREGTKNVWRHYDLPASVQVEAAKCILSHDGFLHIFVPWCKMEL